MIELVTRMAAAKATTTTTTLATTTTTETALSSKSAATNTTTDMHFNAANSERKRSCHTPQSISCCSHNYQQNNDNNYQHKKNHNQFSKNMKHNHRNNYNLPPLFAFNRHLIHATLLLLVCAVCNCCAGGVGSNESLAYAPVRSRPLQRRHTTAIVKDNNADTDDANLVFVYKCCEKFEIHVDGLCTQVNESGKARKNVLFFVQLFKRATNYII